MKLSGDRVDKRMDMEMDRPDIFGLVIKHEVGSKMSREEIHANSDLLMMAGTETTATALSGLTYNLLSNPGTMDRLTREIRTTFKSASEISGDTLARLPVSHGPFVGRKVLTTLVSIRLSRREPENIPVRCRGFSPQDARINWRDDLWYLSPTKRK